jgi:class III poly(R)-hydroxyalkanoic acid synthase PhaE subunit
MTNEPFDWASDWTAFQQRYWDSLRALNPGGVGASAPSGGSGFATNPWASALDAWWQAAAPAAPSPNQEFFTRLMDQGKSYFSMAEQFTNAFQGAGQAATTWNEVIEDLLNKWKSDLSKTSTDSGDAYRRYLGLSELPLENWQHMLSSLSLFPGDALQGLNIANLDRLPGQLDQFLSVPGVGHTRERQEQYQELGRLWSDYLSALQEYKATYGEIGIKSVEALQERFKELGDEGQGPDSLRALYDLWVDCCEQAYGDYVTSDRYVQIHGNMVNALMALKKHGQMLTDEYLSTFNMPTRRELATIHERFQQLRGENRSLRSELEGLKERLDTIAAASRRTAPRQSPRAPKARKKVPPKTPKAGAQGTDS